MSTTLFDSPPLAAPSVATSRTRWAGRALTGIAVLFLALDTAGKLFAVSQVVDGTRQLGFAPHHVLTIGLIELACLVLYLVPRTAPVGAVLWIGYFGGAIATHLRLENPLLTHTLFPIYVAALLWGGLYLRDPRVRALLGAAR
jgi:hypothetical protein